MKQKPGTLSLTCGITRDQNGSGRRPQVRSNTSGSTSIAMSQRTPSHCPAILVSSAAIALCVAGLL